MRIKSQEIKTALTVMLLMLVFQAGRQAGRQGPRQQPFVLYFSLAGKEK